MTDRRTSHFTWIDILRGLAALGVVWYHMRVDLWVGWQALQAHPDRFSPFDRLTAYLSAPLPFLGSTVMLFFLVSGFCIHHPYVEVKKIGFKSYAVRRFFRIYPPYLLAVIFTILVERISSMMTDESASSLLKMAQTLGMTQNYGANAGQLAANPALWSLPVEMELYLVYPLFLWLLVRVGVGATFVVVSLVSLIALAFLLLGNEWVMGNFAKYWIIWCAGALLAEWNHHRQLPRWRPWYWVFAGASLGACVAARFAGIHNGVQHFIWAAFYFCILWWGLGRPDLISRIPSPVLSGLLFLGRISYSLYLIHFPFFKLAGALWVRCFGAKPANLLIPLAFSGVCLPLAYLFYRSIEGPSHQAARILAGRREKHRTG